MASVVAPLPSVEIAPPLQVAQAFNRWLATSKKPARKPSPGVVDGSERDGGTVTEAVTTQVGGGGPWVTHGGQAGHLLIGSLFRPDDIRSSKLSSGTSA